MFVGTKQRKVCSNILHANILLVFFNAVHVLGWSTNLDIGSCEETLKTINVKVITHQSNARRNIYAFLK